MNFQHIAENEPAGRDEDHLAAASGNGLLKCLGIVGPPIAFPQKDATEMLCAGMRKGTSPRRYPAKEKSGRRLCGDHFSPALPQSEETCNVAAVA